MFDDDRGLLQGTLELLILKTLSWGAMHGYSVASWIERITDDVLRVEEGSLYPALHRMERKGWIEAEWGVSENNRRAKYYSLTEAGRARLLEQSTGWRRFAGAVAKALEATESPELARRP
jgi:PadR family transcriptional regulator PadR